MILGPYTKYGLGPYTKYGCELPKHIKLLVEKCYPKIDIIWNVYHMVDDQKSIRFYSIINDDHNKSFLIKYLFESEVFIFAEEDTKYTPLEFERLIKLSVFK
jgi:hypothetical protein